MASFNIMESVSFGYRLTWRERRYLFYLAAVPVLIKIVCHMTYIMLDWQGQLMRQALVMLPSFFADGWMLAHLSRLIFYDQRWPWRSSGEPAGDAAALEDRARGIMAGMLSFVVVEFLLAGFTDGIFQLAHAGVWADENPSLPGAMIMVAAMLGLLWIFRYFWFYIPAAIRYPLPEFSMSMRGFATSVYMLAVWIACFMPAAILYQFVLTLVFPAGEQTETGAGGEFVAALSGAVFDTAIAVISTAAMAYAIRSMIETWQKKRY